MHLNSVIPCDLTDEQKVSIGNVLVKARAIVHRVSSVAYGEFAIRKFRRDLYSPKRKLDKYLTPDDHLILDEVKSLENLVVSSYAKMVRRIVSKFIHSGKVRGDMEDLVQEGLEMILLTMMGFNGEFTLSNYFWHIVVRHLMDMSKSQLTKKRDLRRQCALGEIDVADSDDEVVDCGEYDIELLKYAVNWIDSEEAEELRLTPLEKMVLQLLVEGRKDAYTEAARLVINPATGKPYSKTSAQNAHRSAQDKVAAVYGVMSKAA
jgi:DNA-directed RNA polymerase specialized sigma24 family protein